MRSLVIGVMVLVSCLMQIGTVTGDGRWRDVIDQYSWDGAMAERVMMCESSGDPTARNGPYVGLFQIDSVLHRWSVEELLIPETNIAAAYEKWEQSGWGPWPRCGNVQILLPNTGHGPGSYDNIE